MSERFEKFRVVLKTGFDDVEWIKRRLGHGYLKL